MQEEFPDYQESVPEIQERLLRYHRMIEKSKVFCKKFGLDPMDSPSFNRWVQIYEELSELLLGGENGVT